MTIFAIALLIFAIALPLFVREPAPELARVPVRVRH